MSEAHRWGLPVVERAQWIADSIVYRDAIAIPEVWLDEWVTAWREIGWHAQLDLRLNRWDATHRLPWSSW